MAAPPVIELADVTRIYRSGDIEVRALKGVNLRIDRGEFVAIVGSSGSGKSTMMAIIGCLDRPTSGRYMFEGVDVAHLDEPTLAGIRSARIGFVFQTFNLLARTSAIENVALPLFYAEPGQSGREPRLARARAGLKALGLGDRENNTPAQLSGGQQQRVAIARALINNPAVLLADEPTGNVDTRTSHEIMEQLVRLNREQNVTIVVVTHEPDIAAYAQRVVTLRDGEIVSDERRAAAGERASGAAISPVPTTAAPSATWHRTWAFSLMVMGAAVQALRRNVMRSSLTMLGVFIGVAALIAMVAVGQGANDAVRKQIESLGTNLLVVMPGATTAGGVRGGSGSASTLTLADALAIRREAPAVAQVSYFNRQLGQIQYGDQNWTTQIQGVSPNYPSITNWSVDIGRGFTEQDDESAAQVVVLGRSVYRQLFAEAENPIGAMVLVKHVPMRVIGMWVPKGQTPFGQDQDDLVMIPFTTAERKVLGVAAPTQQASSQMAATYPVPANPFGLQPRLMGYVNSVFVQAASSGDVDRAIDQVTETLARRHHVKPGDPNDFSVRNLSQIADVVQGSSRIMALLLATVASISLIVGGIGIMNILLVSVTERTREIGLRMAIGARRLHVLLQFLAEAVFLSLAGGAAGIAAGLAASRIISAVAGWPTLVPPVAIAGGFLFSAAVGIFFGFYPARKASRLDPIEALRYE